MMQTYKGNNPSVPLHVVSQLHRERVCYSQVLNVALSIKILLNIHNLDPKVDNKQNLVMSKQDGKSP